jgi:hypothetical protein
MKATNFRHIALSFPETSEGAHMNHPDFRVAGKIFATLSHPDKRWGMVRLPPEEQDNVLREHPAAFNPCSGAWGRQGCTNVLLSAIDKPTLVRVLLVAWRNRAPHKIVQQFESGEVSKRSKRARKPRVLSKASSRKG